MTATIKPPEKGPASQHALRLSSMEVLGFSHAESTWSDSVAVGPARGASKRGRHEATVADLTPEDPGGRLTGGNLRWSLITAAILLVAGLAAFGYWLYQRPLAQEQASLETLKTQAADLEASIPALEAMNEELLASSSSAEPAALSEIENAARSLFATSADLPGSRTETRTAASQASGAALDSIRLLTEARSYRAAVLPTLATPELETDPEVIALDEAARQFGDWQLAFDTVRTALPDGLLSGVTQELDILSGNLPSILGRYVDALREDDMGAADAVVADLGERLDAIGDRLNASLSEVQARVDTRLEETRQALDRILGA